MRALLFLLPGVLACSGPDSKDDNSDATGDDGGTDGGGTGDDGGAGDDGGSGDDGGTGDDWSDLELNGDWPDEAIPAPEFTVTNRDGNSRTREDLLGHPTVMWFYPAAASSG